MSVCIYIKCVVTNLFCRLPRTFPSLSNHSTEKTKTSTDFLCIFSISAVSSRHNGACLTFKIITSSHSKFIETTTHVSRSYYFITVFLCRLFTSETAQRWYTVWPVLCHWQIAAYCYVLCLLTFVYLLCLFACFPTPKQVFHL